MAAVMDSVSAGLRPALAPTACSAGIVDAVIADAVDADAGEPTGDPADKLAAAPDSAIDRTGAAPRARAATGLVLVDIGSLCMAVAVANVVQAIVWPARLDLLPRRDSAACGVFDYQGAPLAMLDLARWLDLGTAPATATAATSKAAGGGRYPRALIVRAGDQLVAIGVDAVRGLQQVAAADITRLSHDDNAEEIFHSVARCVGQDGVANVLDVSRLMTLARTWRGEAGMAEQGQQANAIVAASDASGEASTPLASPQRYGVVPGIGCHLGLPVADLVEVIAAPPLARFDGALSAGLCVWRGRHVPVTSLARCFSDLAAAANPLAAAPLLAVFERDGLALGVLLDQVPVIATYAATAGVALCAVAAHAVASAGAAANPAPASAEGSHSDHAVQELVYLVGMDALYARFPERLLSRDADAAAPRAALQQGRGSALHPTLPASQTNASSHILFDADGVASTPIDGIEAVLALPSLTAGATHMAWRGAALPLRDLRAPASAREHGTVIVVKGEHAPLGLIVDSVQALVRARAGRVSRLAMPGQGVLDLLTVDGASGQATYTTRDLARLASAFV